MQVEFKWQHKSNFDAEQHHSGQRQTQFLLLAKWVWKPTQQNLRSVTARKLGLPWRIRLDLLVLLARLVLLALRVLLVLLGLRALLDLQGLLVLLALLVQPQLFLAPLALLVLLDRKDRLVQHRLLLARRDQQVRRDQ
jgi:hypothetical protein